MTLFYISGHRKFETKSKKVMKYEKTLVNFKPFFEFFDIWVPITFRDKELMVWNFEFPSFLLCPTIPFLPFWAIRKTGQIISIWTQFQQMLKIIEIAHMYLRCTKWSAVTIVARRCKEGGCTNTADRVCLYVFASQLQ